MHCRAPMAFHLLLAAVAVATSVRAADTIAADVSRVVDTYLAGPVKERTFSGVVLVAKDGKPLHRKAYGLADEVQGVPNTPDTGFMIFSVTKQFTAALILRLQDRGKLSVNDPVTKYFAEWPKPWEKVTIHHLLTHSSGIEVDSQYFWLVKHYPEFWEDKSKSPPPFEMKALLSEPGTRFRYSNAGYTVLTLIAAKAGGKPYADLIRAELFQPLGMARTGFAGAMPPPARARGYRLTNGAPELSEQKTIDIVGAGDAVTTVDDLLKWDEALYGDALLSSAARKAMFTPFVPGKNGSFGYGWLVRESAPGRSLQLFSGSGAGFAAYVIRVPEEHLYVAVLCNRESEGPFPHGLGVLDAARVVLNGTKR
ncbi:MAG: serine hydrolase domain-containing protein [Gemmataceae bacterium]